MTEPLLTISAFARAVDLAPSALRYYDESGLLRPAEVDDRTGYRYYTPDLERRAHMIRRMREVGVPVETMRLVLDGPADQATELLRGFAARATESARHTATAVAEVIANLSTGDIASDPVVISVDGPELAAALRRVSRAADDDSESPLGVVLLDVADKELAVVGTDRYWLARWSIHLGEVNVGERRVVVPVEEIDGLTRWLSRQDAITLAAGTDGIRLTGDDDDRPVPTSVDRFPAYRLIVDSQPPARGRATVDRAGLLAAMAAAEPTVQIRAAHDRLTVSPWGVSEGVHLDATTAGEPFSVALSSALLASALTALVGSEASLSYVAPDRAVRITSADQRSFTALVMPSRLDG